MAVGQRIDFISGFRALAALWVLVAHCEIWGGGDISVLGHPKLAVDLFMIISGFLMAETSEKRWEKEPLTNPRSRVGFWLRRYFRLAPAFYLSLLAAALTVPLVGPGLHWLQDVNRSNWPIGGTYDVDLYDFSAMGIVIHASFLSGLLPAFVSSLPVPDWSLSLEMQFYFAFPFLVIAMRKYGTRRVAFVVSVTSFQFVSWYTQRVYFAEPSFLLLKIQCFLAGVLLFDILREKSTVRDGVLSAALGVSLCMLERRYGAERWLVAALFLAVAGIGLLSRAKEMPRALAYIFSHRVTLFASDVSYGVYLFHGLLIGLCAYGLSISPWAMTMSPQARSLALLFTVTPAAYGLAWLVRRYVELPCINMGRRVTAAVERRGSGGVVTAPR
jgi:peptidoglycan/LPS O-acetylase OafA/YrhL